MPIAPERILFEDDSLLIVLKLSRELVVKGKGEVRKLPLLDFLKKQYPGLHPAHRLDFETSGVLVFAKSSLVLQKILDTGFDQWKKKYQTIVVGPISGKGVIEKQLPSRTKGEDIPAHTEYWSLKVFKGVSHIECLITTGRQHQIRRHMAMIGHPLVLDDIYGDKKFNSKFAKKFHYNHFFLHAAAIEFIHPVTKQPMKVEAPLSQAFKDCLKKLSNG